MTHKKVLLSKLYFESHFQKENFHMCHTRLCKLFSKDNFHKQNESIPGSFLLHTL